MIPLPSIRSLSGDAVQGIARAFCVPHYAKADYRKLRVENARRFALCRHRRTGPA